MADFYQAALGAAQTVDLDLSEVLEPVEGLAGGYPKVELVEDGDVLQTVTASSGSPVTNYSALLNIPDVIDLTGVDFKTLQVVWRIKTASGKTYKVVQSLQVIANDGTKLIQRELVFILGTAAPQDIEVVLDFSLNTSSDPTPLLDVYHGNTAIATGIAASTYASRGESSVAAFSLSSVSALRARFVEYNLIVRGTRSGRPYNYSCPLYVTNPSIKSAAETLRHFLSKARIQNVIPSLNYTDANLFLYLQRGLDWFNSYPPTITTFDGTNMMGAVRNGWLLCAQYYGLMAQYSAENDLDFDFSGQSVTLRIDRKSGIETLLGRIDTELDRTIKPFKSLLAKGGIIGGDGSGDGNGNFNADPRAMGKLHIGQHSMINFGMGNRTPWPFGLTMPFVRRQ